MNFILLIIGYSIFALIGCFYIAIFYTFNLDSSNKSNFGAFGDTIGGIINPVLAFISFIALLYTISITNKNQKSLSFESTFQSLLDQHNKTLNQISAYDGLNEGPSKIEITLGYVIASSSLEEACEYLAYQDEETDHYFRVVYQILSHIDKNHPSSNLGLFNSEQKNYSNILRSIIDQKTLFLIAVNAASSKHISSYKNYQLLIEKSNFLEHLKYKKEFHPLIKESITVYNKKAFGKSIFFDDYSTELSS